MGYMVWGKIHGIDNLIKLRYEEKRRAAVAWMINNKVYYEDMRIYKFKKEE